jgi:hypothetical protein
MAGLPQTNYSNTDSDTDSANTVPSFEDDGNETFDTPFFDDLPPEPDSYDLPPPPEATYPSYEALDQVLMIWV